MTSQGLHFSALIQRLRLKKKGPLEIVSLDNGDETGPRREAREHYTAIHTGGNNTLTSVDREHYTVIPTGGNHTSVYREHYTAIPTGGNNTSVYREHYTLLSYSYRR